MKLTNWRWWQWLILSLPVGIVIAYAFLQMEPADPTLPSVPFSHMRFRLERVTDTGQSILTRIRVSPPLVDGNGKKTQTVTYWERQRNRNTGQWDPVQRFITHADYPLTPGGNKSVMDFLAETKQRIPTLDYRFQWWLVPANIWAVALGGSILVIGILWPMALKTMVKLGLAEPPDERMDLSAIRTTKNDVPDRVAASKVTAGDQQKLADLTAALEENVAGMATAGSGGSAHRPHADAPVKDLKLTAEPLTPATASAAKEEDNEYGGEFYPVAKPHHKKDT
jgi:hypothetical protein